MSRHHDENGLQGVALSNQLPLLVPMVVDQARIQEPLVRTDPLRQCKEVRRVAQNHLVEKADVLLPPKREASEVSFLVPQRLTAI
jgi:hypothetical protein